MIWKIALETIDDNVAKEIITFLVTLYLNVIFLNICFVLFFTRCFCFLKKQISPSLAEHRKHFRESFIDKCISELSASLRQPDEMILDSNNFSPKTKIARCLFVLKVEFFSFFLFFFKKNRILTNFFYFYFFAF